jgi:hypothetical protein
MTLVEVAHVNIRDNLNESTIQGRTANSISD